MAIMGLSKLSKFVFDEVRCQWVAATPEERVRQTLLKKMITHLGFPKESLAVEKELKSLPHLFQSQVPDRRADLICFAKDIHESYPLYPLLLIECKEGDLDEAARQQVVGYNYFVKAPFIALASLKEEAFGFYDPVIQAYSFLPYIPSYFSLLKAARIV